MENDIEDLLTNCSATRNSNRLTPVARKMT